MFGKFKKDTCIIDAWKDDANEMGLTENIQKGLMFLIALGMRIDPQLQSPESLINEAKKICPQLSHSSPHIPEGLGGDFFDGQIEKIFTEFIERSAVNFESKVIKLPTGDELKVWNRYEVDQLPECLTPKTEDLSDWENIITVMCELIGAQIGDDLEEAFVDGFLFFDSYAPMDAQGLYSIISLANGMLPPHFMWFKHCLNFTAEQLSQGNPVQKVLNCFLGPPDPLLYPNIVRFSDNIHYTAPGQKSQIVWNASVAEFALYAGRIQLDIGSQTSEPWYEDAIQKLKDQGYKTPPICESESMLGGVLCGQVKEKWGYDILEELNEPNDYCNSPGAQYTRRACISMLCIANAFLQPEWNSFADKKR